MDRDRTDPYGFGRRDERPRGDGGDGGRDLKRPRRGYDPSAAPPPGRYDAPPPRHYPVPGYAGYQVTRTVNGTGHTGPSEFCATSI